MPYNLEEIVSQVVAAQAKWVAGATSITVLSDAERTARLGFVPAPGELSMDERVQRATASLPEHARTSATTIPVSVDWRNMNGHSYISSIKDQGSCGSCVAFGSAAAIDAGMRISLADPVGGPGISLCDVSEAQLFYCGAEQQQHRTCATGWWPNGGTGSLDYAQGTGLVCESVFPYTAGDQPCNLPSNWQSCLTKISGYTTIDNVAQMKQALAQTGPLVTCFSVYSDFFAYTSGVYRRTSNVYEGGHCVCVCGYDDNQQAWLCKNSWGTGWGEQGFFWIGYGQCGIDGQMYSINGFTSICTPWPNGKTINGVDSTPAALSASVFNNKLTLFWKANDPSNHIFHSASADGNSWPNGQTINGVDSTPAAPASAVFNNQLHVFWKANDPSNHIFHSASANGTSWPNGKTINGVDATPAAPASCVFNNHLYVFWKANDSSNHIFYSASADGVTWPNGKTINGVDSTPVALAACVYGNKLYLFWKANDTSNHIFYSASADGQTWPSGKLINGSDSTPQPLAAIVVGGELYLFWKANDASNRIFFSGSSDGATWPAGRVINTADSTPQALATAEFGGNTYLVWKANDSSNHIFFTKRVL
jgi:C1A family cysteine protease